MAKHVKRLTIWSIGLAATAAATGLVSRRWGGDAAAQLTYRTQPVERGRVEAIVAATGTLSPLNTVQVGSQVSGRILELFADFNSEVVKGQAIATIDPSIFASNVAKAEATLQASRAAVTKAEAALDDAAHKYERSQALAVQRLVAAADVETALATYKSAQAELVAARAELSQSRAALDQAKVNLAYTTIVSPIDGTVISRDVEVGQTVAASLQAPTLFTIAEDLRKMELHTSVAESDVGKLQPDMDVTFTVDAFPDEQFRGTVRQIRNAPQTVQNVVTYDAVVSVANDELRLRPGMTANVTYIVARRRDVLLVPNAALRFSPPEDQLAHLSAEDQALVASAQGRRGGAGGRPPGGAHAPAPEANADASDADDAGPGRGGRPPRDASVRVVWVLVDRVPRPLKVKIGITDGSSTEVTAGDLDEGATLITGIEGAAPPQRGPAGGSPSRRVFF
jgi:HlyD family secretion protein